MNVGNKPKHDKQLIATSATETCQHSVAKKLLKKKYDKEFNSTM